MLRSFLFPALAAAGLALAGCSTGLSTQVTRYQSMPAPSTALSFAVVPADPADAGKIQFNTYADLVATALAAKGYQRAASPDSATMLVRLGYDVEENSRLVEAGPIGIGHGVSAYDRWRYARAGVHVDPRYYDPRLYDPRWGLPGVAALPYRYGWADPRLGGYGYGYGYPYGRELREVSVYQSRLALDIRRKGDNQQLFDGTVLARSQTGNLNRLVPSMVTAMFSGFPGKSGETIRITVPDKR